MPKHRLFPLSHHDGLRIRRYSRSLFSHFALYEALLPYYRDQPGDCVFVAHANGHRTPDAVKESGFGWLVQQLDSGI